MNEGTVNWTGGALRSGNGGSFTNAAGSLRFADLVAKTGPDSTGESIDISGRIEWTCPQEVVP